jgi:hypothetical protein
MKKIKQLINNVYRICVVNPIGRNRHISYKEETDEELGLLPDSMLRQIIAEDQLQFEADPQIQEILRQRVRNNGHHIAPAKNSLLDLFLPLFSSQHIEIKMAVVSLALFILVGLGPKNNQASDRKMHLFFLADTLGDSSSFHHPAAQDTAFRVQYK